jgi:hypothetical protein
MMTPTKLEHIDPVTRTWLSGVPRSNHYVGAVIQVLQVPGYVVILYEANHAYRVIPLDARPHLAGSFNLFMGDSRGLWEGNMLVVDVTNQRASWLDKLSFHGDSLHVVERWTLVSSDRIEYRATFEAPTMFTQPWTIAYLFERDKAKTADNYELWEDARREGERDVEHILRAARQRKE